jgi:hypothetical protein
VGMSGRRNGRTRKWRGGKHLPILEMSQHAVSRLREQASKQSKLGREQIKPGPTCWLVAGADWEQD